MILTIEQARKLVVDCMTASGLSVAEGDIIADHLIDSELRGLSYAGLPRAISILEQLRTIKQRRPISVLRETASSAHLDGGNQVGYLVGRRATEIAIEKAGKTGVAVVGASKTWYTGMFSYYLEIVTNAGFVGMIAGSGNQMVAPYGGTEPRFSTNPIAFGFPSNGDPVIWDIGTSASTMAELVLKKRLGEPLQDGLAYDASGQPTTDPAAALQGAIVAWGGHRGSGLAMSVQLLGMLAGQINLVHGLDDCGFFILVVDPGLFGTAEEFRARVSEFMQSLRSTRPIDPSRPVRIPFERSAAERRDRRSAGQIEASDVIVSSLREACGAWPAKEAAAEAV